MNKQKTKLAFSLFVTVFLVLGLSMSFQSLLAAWSAPTAVAPANNTSGPIFSTSAVAQTIEGGSSLAVFGPIAATRAAFAGWISGDGDNEGIFINSAGYVGIGNSAPMQKLDVTGNVKADRFYNTDINYFADLKNGATLGGSWAISTGAASVVINSGRITATGNIIAAPATLGNHLTTRDDVLTLISSNAGTINSGTAGQIAYYSATGRVLSSTPYITLSGATTRIDSLSINGAYTLPNYNGGTGVFLRGDGQWAAVPAGATLPAGSNGQTIRNSSGTWVADSNLYNNGTNVGIGNTAPQQKLDVSGIVRASAFLDSENGTYYVNPDTSSRLAGSLLLEGGATITSTLQANTSVTSARFNDNNAAYYADLDTGGNLGGNWNMTGKIYSQTPLASDPVNTVTTKGYVDAAVAAAGGGGVCTTYTTASGNCSAYCPIGWRLVDGGCRNTPHPAYGVYGTMLHSYPDLSGSQPGWFCARSDQTNQAGQFYGPYCTTAYVLCCR